MITPLFWAKNLEIAKYFVNLSVKISEDDIKKAEILEIKYNDQNGSFLM